MNPITRFLEWRRERERAAEERHHEIMRIIYRRDRMLALTRAAVTGICADPNNTGLTAKEVALQAVDVAAATLDAVIDWNRKDDPPAS